MDDPRGVGTVSIELNNTLAELLAKLCVELDTEDVTGVLSRALGLFEMVQRTKRQGGRLCFINEHGEIADVVA
jgi:pimeloyl-CoA synthetase